MIHYSCDRCKRPINPKTDLRYVVRLETQAMMDLPDFQDSDDERDHLLEIEELLDELGEIEAQLIKHESVSECVLLLREDNPGDQRLVAYFVAAHESPDPTSIREHLRINLPEYMVPNDVV